MVIHTESLLKGCQSYLRFSPALAMTFLSVMNTIVKNKRTEGGDRIAVMRMMDTEASAFNESIFIKYDLIV